MKPMIKLTDAYKTVRDDQDKVLAPEETLRRFHEKLKTVRLDILKRTVRIDSGRIGIPVFFSQCGVDAASVMGTRKQMGKGATPAQAEASAVMELAERFSFYTFNQNPENFRTGTYREMGKNALPFSFIAQSVHDDSKDLKAAQTIFETLPMRWTWATNLTTQKPVLIPFDWFFAINEFNGTSAGNCPEEAICQGICEVVERHVSSIVSRFNKGTPAIQPESSSDPLAREMIDKYTRNGIRLFLSDFTLNMGIPTVAILSYDPENFPQKSEIVWTAGTCPSPEKALSRALSETAQLAGDFNTGSNYVASGLPKFDSLVKADFITSIAPDTRIQDLPDLSHDNIRIEVERLVSALGNQNMEVFVVDTRHPELDIPAYYTIIPGAHFRERAMGKGVAMFTAKLAAENLPAQRALERLKEMDTLLPEKYFVRFYMGSARLELNDPEGALKDYAAALALNPNLEDAAGIHSYMGICLKEMARYKEAIDVLEKGEALDAERTDIPNLMGFCHYKLKNHRQAIACFEKVLALDPSSAIDYANIASNYRDMGDTEMAIAYYQKALNIDPGIDFARENILKLVKEKVKS